ncbi:MAG TPA: hypothetical protein VKS19_04625, partial [Verrucomicrobiae bacterium]|nr:hypothetical protein [Verrucomicrobiae bacterium]
AFAVGYLFESLAKSKEAELDRLKPEVQQMQEKFDRFNKIYGEVGTTRQEADQVAAWMNNRYYWGDVLADLRQVLIRAENDVQKKLSAERQGVQAGIWIEQLTSMAPLESANTPGRLPSAGGLPGIYNIGPAPGPGAANTGPAQTNQAGAITLVCRAVSLSSVDPAANSDIAYTLENELQASPYFDPKATQLVGQINAEDVSGTFTFGITAVLKKPLNL